jgi:AcrR family transcriptional regulator
VATDWQQGGPPATTELIEGGGWRPRRLAAVAIELPPGVTPAGTKGEILRAALALFSEFGFHGTSVRQVAAIVGVNPATLYAHYPAKEQILADLVLIGHQELHARLSAALEAAGTDAAGRLAALVRAHALIHCDYPLLALVANAELHALTPAAAEAALLLRSRCADMLTTVLAEGARSGEFALIDPMITALGISGLGMHIAHWFDPGEAYARDQVAEAHVRLVLRMAGAADTAARDNYTEG